MGTPQVFGPAMPDGPSWPRITLITPSLNQGASIERTIRSVLLQGYPNLEYIVMDGGSTDGTVDAIRRYEPWLSAWVSEKDRGQSHAINRGLSRCTGEIVNWLNSDDVLMPGALAGVAALYRRHPKAVAWAGACRRVDENGRLVVVYRPKGLTRDGLADWYFTGYVAQPACFFSKAASDRIGPVNEKLHFSMDMDYWLRLAAVGEFASTDEIWCEEISHPACKCRAHPGLSVAEKHLVQMLNGYPDLAVKQMAAVIDDNERMKTGSFLYRTLWRLNVVLRPVLEMFRKRR